MSDAIVVLNAGSSSLKFCIYGVAGGELTRVAGGQIEGLGTAPRFKAKDDQGRVLADAPLSGSAKEIGHSQGFAHLAQWAREHYAGEYEPVAIGHRMVHGGLKFTEPTLITPDVIDELEQLVPLVPLHQPHNLAGVRAVTQLRPDLPQVACFDTAFHRGRPSVSERFGLPDEMFQQGVRRWGFHGLSYESISSQLRQIAPALRQGRVIVAHLGSGASLCAMRGGRSVETTMGFSALDGLPMGTRCGSLDPGVILFLLQRGMTASQIETLLYKKSGLLGISGVSNDVRDLLASDNPLAKEAIGYFVYRIVRDIGSLTAALGGLDGLVFTAGVGENSPLIRQRVCAGLEWLSIAIDAEANRKGRGCISPPGASPAVWVIPTDEEGVIAAHTLAVARSSMQIPKVVAAAGSLAAEG
ncbi:MAG TPA: acetate/propionate family kinase [Tepidisphaeraceae bacterium]|jgi:acetate kinase